MNETKRLMRSRDDKLIAGVCGGLGVYFNLDATLIRLAFALLVFLGAGTPILAYLLLWLIIPLEGAEGTDPRSTVKANVDEMVEQTRAVGKDLRERVAYKPKSSEPESNKTEEL